MLFLFNDVVFDLGDPRESIFEMTGAADFSEAVLFNMRVGRAIKLVRECIYEEPLMARSNPDRAMFLAALAAWKTNEANAMLAVAPRDAVSPDQVQVRLASVSLVMMSQLQELQGAGKLSSHVANMSVWSHAPTRMQA